MFGRPLLLICRRCCRAEDWSAKKDNDGRLYYFNRVTGEVSWQHPLRGMFLKLVGQQRKDHASAGVEGPNQHGPEHTVHAQEGSDV